MTSFSKDVISAYELPNACVLALWFGDGEWHYPPAHSRKSLGLPPLLPAGVVCVLNLCERASRALDALGASSPFSEEEVRAQFITTARTIPHMERTRAAAMASRELAPSREAADAVNRFRDQLYKAADLCKQLEAALLA